MSETAATPDSTTGAAAAAAVDPVVSPAPAAVDPAAPPSILDEPTKAATDPAAAAAPVIPDTYEFKPPEVDGKPAEVDGDALTAFQALAKDAKLTQEQFQALGEHGSKLIADRMAAMAEANIRAGVAAFEATVKEWGEQTKADPEVGGDKFPAAMANLNRTIATFGDEAVREVLMKSGAGNHPALFKMLSKIGAAIANPTVLSFGKPASAAPKSGEQMARDMYNQGGGNYSDVAA